MKLAALTSICASNLFFLNETNSINVNLVTVRAVFVGQGQMNFDNPITEIPFFFFFGNHITETVFVLGVNDFRKIFYTRVHVWHHLKIKSN